MIRAVAIVAALAGCDRVLGLSGGFADARPDAPTCTMPPVFDSFDADPACNSWGHAYGDATGSSVALAGGQLVITPGPSGDAASSHSGCASSGAFAFGPGIFIQVTDPPHGDEYMIALLGLPDATNLRVQWSPTTVSLSHGAVLGTVPFDVASSSWIRVRPSDDGATVIAEASGDGLGWQLFATDPAAPPSTVTLNLVGGLLAPDPIPQPIRFDGLDVCPGS